MSLSGTILGAGTALVFGASVYLLHEVRATPSAPSGSVTRHVADPPPPPPALDADPAPAPPGRRAASVPLLHVAVTPPAPAPAAPDGSAGSDAQHVDIKGDALMDQANKAYDAGDLEDAAVIAAKVLITDPRNTRMMRIMVSASCQTGDNATAQKYYAQLAPPDRAQMKTRCSRYSVVLTDP